MAGVPPVSPLLRFSDSLGRPLVGGTLTVYQGGTTTLADTWMDQGLTILNTNPITLNANGECLVWLDPDETYKFLLKNSAGVTQTGYPVDDISGLLPDENTLVTRSGAEAIDNKLSLAIGSATVPGYSLYDNSSDLKFFRGESGFGTKFGYANASGGSGVGGTVTQLTSKTTTVTLNKASGVITTHAQSMSAGQLLRFGFSNTYITDDDSIIVHRKTGGTDLAYEINCDKIYNGACEISIKNLTVVALAEAIQIRFTLIRGASA